MDSVSGSGVLARQVGGWVPGATAAPGTERWGIPDMVEHNAPANVNQGTTEKLPSDWTEITSVEQAMAVIEQSGMKVEDISQDIGDGFELIENKDTLCGVPMIGLGWRTNLGDFSEFVSIRAIIKDGPWEGKKVIFNDGSTGIKDQLHQIENKRGLANSAEGWVFFPFNLEKGLRRSDYEYTDDKGKTLPATTYYFA